MNMMQQIERILNRSKSFPATIDEAFVSKLIARYKPRISGGIAEKKRKTPSDFPMQKLIDGIKVEKEHTGDLIVALEIATDHLSENVNYYDNPMFKKEIVKGKPIKQQIGMVLLPSKLDPRKKRWQQTQEDVLSAKQPFIGKYEGFEINEGKYESFFVKITTNDKEKFSQILRIIQGIDAWKKYYNGLGFCFKNDSAFLIQQNLIDKQNIIKHEDEKVKTPPIIQPIQQQKIPQERVKTYKTPKDAIRDLYIETIHAIGLPVIPLELFDTGGQHMGDAYYEVVKNATTSQILREKIVVFDLKYMSDIPWDFNIAHEIAHYVQQRILGYTKHNLAHGNLTWAILKYMQGIMHKYPILKEYAYGSDANFSNIGVRRAYRKIFKSFSAQISVGQQEYQVISEIKTETIDDIIRIYDTIKIIPLDANGEQLDDYRMILRPLKSFNKGAMASSPELALTPSKKNPRVRQNIGDFAPDNPDITKSILDDCIPASADIQLFLPRGGLSKAQKREIAKGLRQYLQELQKGYDTIDIVKAAKYIEHYALAVQILGMPKLEKGKKIAQQPGMALLPSKKEPRKKRWQKTQGTLQTESSEIHDGLDYLKRNQKAKQDKFEAINNETESVREQGRYAAFGNISRGLANRFERAVRKVSDAANKSVRADIFCEIAELWQLPHNEKLWYQVDKILQNMISARDLGDNYSYGDAMRSQYVEAKIKAIEYFMEKYANTRIKNILKEILSNAQSSSIRDYFLEKNKRIKTSDSPNEWQIESESHPGKFYKVQWHKYAGKEILSCDCPIWKFNKRGNRTCKHTDEVAAKLKKEGKDIEYPPKLGKALLRNILSLFKGISQVVHAYLGIGEHYEFIGVVPDKNGILRKAVIRTPTTAEGKVDWSSVPVGATIFVTVSNSSSPLRGRAIPITKRPDGQFALDFEGAARSGYKYGKHITESEKMRAYSHHTFTPRKAEMKEMAADVEKQEKRRIAKKHNKPIINEMRVKKKEMQSNIKQARVELFDALGIAEKQLSFGEIDKIKEAAVRKAEEIGLDRDKSQKYVDLVLSAVKRRTIRMNEQRITNRLQKLRELYSQKIKREESATEKLPSLRTKIPKEYAPTEGKKIDYEITMPSVDKDDSIPEMQNKIIQQIHKQHEESIIPLISAEKPTTEKPPQSIPEPSEKSPTISLEIEEKPIELEGLSDDLMNEIVDKVNTYNESRTKLNELRKQLVEVEGAEEILSSSDVAETRLAVEQATQESAKNWWHEESSEQSYSHGYTSFYEAVSEFWNDKIGYTLNGSVIEGATAGIVGLLGKYLKDDRLIVNKLVKTLGTDTAVLVLAYRMRVWIDLNGIKKMRGKILNYNAENSPKIEEKALNEHKRLVSDWQIIQSQKASGELTNAETIVELETENLRAQRANIGHALGSLNSSAEMLVALDRAISSDTDEITINCGKNKENAQDRFDELRLNRNIAQITKDEDGNWVIVTAANKLNRYVEDVFADVKLNKQLETIKNSEHPTRNYNLPYFKKRYKDDITGAEKEFVFRKAQRNDIEWLDKLGGGVITRVTGSGKTLSALGFASRQLQKDKSFKMVIVVPNGQVDQWTKEGGKFTDLPIVKIPEGLPVEERMDIYEKIKPGSIVVVSHKNATTKMDVAAMEGMKYDSICIDEPQQMKSATSPQRSAGARRIMSLDIPHRIALTATIAREDAIEAYDMVNWAARRPMKDEKGNIKHNKRGNIIYDKPLGDRTKFARAYTGWGKGTNAQDEAIASMIYREISPYVSGDLIKDRDYNIANRQIMVKRSQPQIDRQKEIEKLLPGLIEKEYANYPQDKKRGNWKRKAERRALEKLIRQHALNLSGGDDNAKVNSAADAVSDSISKGKGKHIIFIDSAQQRAAVIESLRKKGMSTRQIANITKGISKTDIEKRKRAWWDNPNINVILIDSTSSAGHNLNAADAIHILGNPKDAAEMVQAIGRGDRAPRKGDFDVVTYRYEDAPFDALHWDRIRNQVKLLQATAPALASAVV